MDNIKLVKSRLPTYTNNLKFYPAIWDMRNKTFTSFITTNETMVANKQKMILSEIGNCNQ